MLGVMDSNRNGIDSVRFPVNFLPCPPKFSEGKGKGHKRCEQKSSAKSFQENKCFVDCASIFSGCGLASNADRRVVYSRNGRFTEQRRVLMRNTNPIADLRQQIHHDLRIQHPEWVLPNGESPICDVYEARLMDLLAFVSSSPYNAGRNGTASDTRSTMRFSLPPSGNA